MSTVLPHDPLLIRKPRKTRLAGYGRCKLTLAHGRYVKSHIIPKAFTKPERAGASWLQSGRGTRPLTRWDSWYDKALVTREGEDILARYDEWAVKELRKQKLVWSSWGPMRRLSTPDLERIPRTEWGLRRIRDMDHYKLRLFFLSLLWRAAASDMWEFANIQLEASHLDTLREMVLNRTAEPYEFYPIVLIQLSTLGEVHNLTPLVDDKLVHRLNDAGERLDQNADPILIPIFRFYFDGLIAHIHRDPSVDRETIGRAMIGYDLSELWASTVTYEISFESQNLKALKAEIAFPV